MFPVYCYISVILTMVKTSIDSFQEEKMEIGVGWRRVEEAWWRRKNRGGRRKKRGRRILWRFSVCKEKGKEEKVENGVGWREVEEAC